MLGSSLLLKTGVITFQYVILSKLWFKLCLI